MSVWSMEDFEYVNERTGEFALDTDELSNLYRDYLNEETVSILGLEYGVGDALREVDPIAFRCGLADWMDEAGWNETASLPADEVAALWNGQP